MVITKGKNWSWESTWKITVHYVPALKLAMSTETDKINWEVMSLPHSYTYSTVMYSTINTDTDTIYTVTKQ